MTNMQKIYYIFIVIALFSLFCVPSDTLLAYPSKHDLYVEDSGPPRSSMLETILGSIFMICIILFACIGFAGKHGSSGCLKIILLIVILIMGLVVFYNVIEEMKKSGASMWWIIPLMGLMYLIFEWIASKFDFK